MTRRPCRSFSRVYPRSADLDVVATRGRDYVSICFPREPAGEFATEPPAKRMQGARAAGVQKCLLFERHTTAHVLCRGFLALRPARKLRVARYTRRLTEVVRPRWPRGKCDENSSPLTWRRGEERRGEERRGEERRGEERRGEERHRPHTLGGKNF
jgi:hypothetical protein